MKNDKEILDKLNIEIESVTPKSFSSIKENILKSDKYISQTIKKEGENIVPNEKIEVEENTKKKFDWRIAIFVPAALGVAIAVPISIHFATQPVAPCEASVKLEFSDGTNEVCVRANMNNNEIDTNSFKGLNDFGHIFKAGIRKLNYFEDKVNIDELINRSKSFLSEHNILSIEQDVNLGIIHKDKNYVPNMNFIPSNIIFMGNKSDYHNVEKAISVLDIGNRIFEGLPEYNGSIFNYENILKYAKNNGDFAKLSQFYKDIDTWMPTNDNLLDFQKDFKIELDKIDLPSNKLIDKFATALTEFIMNDSDAVEGINKTYFNKDKNFNEYEFWVNRWDFES